MLKFAAAIVNPENGENMDYSDPGLFESDAKHFGKDKGTRYGHMAKVTANGRLSAQIRKGWKAPAKRKHETPTGAQIGSEVVFHHDGEVVQGQVWSEAPNGGVWVATSTALGFVWMHKKTHAVYFGTYQIPAYEMQSYRQADARAAA